MQHGFWLVFFFCNSRLIHISIKRSPNTYKYVYIFSFPLQNFKVETHKSEFLAMVASKFSSWMHCCENILESNVKKKVQENCGS